ncbi:MAG: citrate synthase [Thermoplasmata archaeon]
MMEEAAAVSKGLEDVYIKTTKLTTIDGNKGILRYRGYDINDISEHGTFEEVIHLMVYGELPNKEQLKALRDSLKSHYALDKGIMEVISKLPRDGEPLGMLEVAFSMLAMKEKNYKWEPKTDREKAIDIIAKAVTIVANIYRVKEGLPVKEPVIKESYAETFMSTCFDKPVSKEVISSMDKALILYTDHEVPASTTASLVVASTLSDMASSVVAGIAALKGPLHGGAAETAFKQFEDIGDVDKVEPWFKENIINNKAKLMGFGHRVYKTMDPRAKIFKRYSEMFAKDNPKVDKYFQIAKKLEELGVKEFGNKGIYPNTDFYSGIVYYAMGFPTYMPTPLFALSRTTGWLSHIMEYVEEQQRIIRPRAIYVGIQERKYVPIDQRH